ncbi:hypothetical protein [Saccharothrix syringae]|uniref:Uncharacterized protein n=1 Tax=Saccharothrix syringae TaxID=103733 RepID=A0A5Q0GRM4_SACSY|nr:hypothetical protein [Saccharothrix syringae]QFZ16573.1 hypothetical protein EKG83_03005 [Saccharothrix syringae]
MRILSTLIAPDAGRRSSRATTSFTPVTDILRGPLISTPIGDSGYRTVGRCVLPAVVGYAWSRALFNRDPSR